jgi:hypothetical protein
MHEFRFVNGKTFELSHRVGREIEYMFYSLQRIILSKFHACINYEKYLQKLHYSLDKPSPPGGPLKVSDIHAEGCKLNWNPPADDGGQPIDKYVVEKMDEASGKISLLKTKTTETSYVLNH